MDTILIIDDEPALLLALAAKTKRRGFTVITAIDGEDGLQKARETLPDLIVSDVMMPPPNGFELRRLMREDPQLATIPFIFLTARTGVDDRVSGLKDGADDYITKPFETEELFARIEAVFRRVQTEQTRGREEIKLIAQQDMEKLKQEILQNYHHELGTPLTNILLPLELADKNRFENPEETSQFIKIALSNADRLESLVTDLIILSDIDQKNLNSIRQVIDLNTNIIGPVQKRFDRYKNKKLNLSVDCPEHGLILAPRREFTHSIVHLVDNALKFSPENGDIHLTITPLKNGGGSVLVRDNGPGIPADFQDKVFDRFYQISQGGKRENEGLGVGLTIARAVFSSLGGSVEIIESPEGCTVRALLPEPGKDDIIYE
jgi:signal transduction histidine kinase